MVTDSAFNLRALATDVVASSTTGDVNVMLDDFVAQIDPSNYRDALRYLARGLIEDILHKRAQRANGGSPRVASRKVAAARDAWRQLLDKPEFLPSSGWVFLREASCAQVMEMARNRRKKSAELNDAAKRYDRLASEMQRRDVQRVGDLPEDVLEANLSVVAS